MSDGPQKVSICKFCMKDITWHKDAVNGKNYPKNLDGTPHLCQSQKPQQTTQEKMQANGFQTGAQVKQEGKADCTSPNTPSRKTIEGQITTLDIPAHKVWLKDREGKEHYFIWGPALHDQMSKLKPYWFVKLTGEYEADVDLWRLEAQEYFKRPDDWPVQKKAWTGQVRNDKIIVLQSCMKVAADVWIARGLCEGTDPAFEDAMAKITAEAIKAAGELCKAGGVQ